MTQPALCRTRAACLAVTISIAGALIAAQAPSFEVASIKPYKSGDFGVRIGMQPDGRFTVSNAPLREIIRLAYQVQDFQIVGAPDWTRSEHFDIVAKGPADMPAPPMPMPAPGGHPATDAGLKWYPIPGLGAHRGKIDRNDVYWFGEYMNDKIGMFDTKTGKSQRWDMTKWSTPYTASTRRAT